jgi:acylphosphatase
MKSLRINVYGRVQGVWFRANTRELAEKLGLDGFVKNEPDGSVYIEVSGPDNIVMQFLNGVMEGPELAKVEKLVITKDSNIHTDGFKIRN